eukprot:4166089-Heterocapsa_arctica.AAC.1
MSLGKAKNEQRYLDLPKKYTYGLGKQKPFLCDLTGLEESSMLKLHPDNKWKYHKKVAGGTRHCRIKDEEA